MKIADIRIDGGTQSRVEIDTEVMGEYADAIHAGAKMPAVTVFFDGVDHWLADGFHRLLAHLDQYLEEIDVEVITGSVVDAKLYAFAANKDHGLRRSNADKRKAVEGMLEIASEWSDRQIASHVGVSVPFVGSVRDPEVAARQQENRERSTDKKGQNCNRITQTSPPESVVETGDRASTGIESEFLRIDSTEDSSQESDGGTLSEERVELEEMERVDREKYEQLIEISHSDDKLAAALKLVDEQAAEIKRQAVEIVVLRERNTGLMNEKVVLESTAKTWMTVAKKLGWKPKAAK